jgi:single stranded DNA-binding protein
MSLNRVMMIGNLGQDSEIRYTPSGLPLVNFSVATDESYLDKEGKRQERVVWHRISAAGKLALVCHEYLKKGRQVFVEARRLSKREEKMALRVDYDQIATTYDTRYTFGLYDGVLEALRDLVD